MTPKRNGKEKNSRTNKYMSELSKIILVNTLIKNFPQDRGYEKLDCQHISNIKMI